MINERYGMYQAKRYFDKTKNAGEKLSFREQKKTDETAIKEKSKQKVWRAELRSLGMRN